MFDSRTGETKSVLRPRPLGNLDPRGPTFPLPPRDVLFARDLRRVPFRPARNATSRRLRRSSGARPAPLLCRGGGPAGSGDPSPPGGAVWGPGRRLNRSLEG